MREYGLLPGMKIALFDVSDVTRPVEKFKTVVGTEGQILSFMTISPAV